MYDIYIDNLIDNLKKQDKMQEMYHSYIILEIIQIIEI